MANNLNKNKAIRKVKILMASFGGNAMGLNGVDFAGAEPDTGQADCR